MDTTLKVELCPSCNRLRPEPFFDNGGDVLWGGIVLRVCRDCYATIVADAQRLREVLPANGRPVGSSPTAGSRAPTLHETTTDGSPVAWLSEGNDGGR